MSKDYTHIKANGLRNELKEIRKSIDKLTNAILAQTNTREKIDTGYSYCDGDDCDCTCQEQKYRGKETGRSFGI